jgi:CheY-like chemotaxis protein
MTEIGATRKLRALNRSDAATVPIIAMTANAFQDDIENSLAAGMNAHLTKPLDVDKIRKTILEMMRKNEKE